LKNDGVQQYSCEKRASLLERAGEGQKTTKPQLSGFVKKTRSRAL
jgi:hypothetical protein